MAEFNLKLLDSEINDFLKQIHVVKAEPSSTFLSEIVSGIVEHVPFQNITMLTGPATAFGRMDKRKCEWTGRIVHARNPFLYSLLKGLGLTFVCLVNHS